MTFFDRELGLTDVEVAEIVSILGDFNLLILESPFTAELQTGKTESITEIRNERNGSVMFITSDKEFPVARIEFNSLEKLVRERINTELFTLK